MRKLARLVTVDEVMVHPNADALELAAVGGWVCCVKKGQFKAGDPAVYCEIDSLLPLDNPHFQFLAGQMEITVEGKVYRRIKTCRLRGELSQGIMFPIDILPEMDGELDVDGEQDVTEVLGILKYEPMLRGQKGAALGGEFEGLFPSFIPKTEAERVQNLKRNYINWVERGVEFEITYKLDGTSFTAFVRDGSTGVCSRNYQLKVNEANANNAYVQMFNKLNLDAKLRGYAERTGVDIAISGELVGPGIQQNFEGTEQHELYIFRVYDINAGANVPPAIARAIVEDLGLNYVPVLDVCRTLPPTVADCVQFASGRSGLNGKFREGLVFKSQDGEIVFKAVSNEYLLKTNN